MRVTRLTTNKFKNNEIAVFLEVPLKRETITKNAILPAVLKRGSANYTSQLEIGKVLENMYGASFNAGVEKTGESLTRIAGFFLFFHGKPGTNSVFLMRKFVFHARKSEH